MYSKNVKITDMIGEHVPTNKKIRMGGE